MKNILKVSLIAAAAIGLSTTATKADDCRRSNSLGQVLSIVRQVSQTAHDIKYHGGYSHYSSPRSYGYSNYRSSSYSRGYSSCAPRSRGVVIRYSSDRNSHSHRHSSYRSSHSSSHKGHRHH